MNGRNLFLKIMLVIIAILLVILIVFFAISIINNKNIIQQNNNNFESNLKHNEEKTQENVLKQDNFNNIGFTNSKCINTNNTYTIKETYNGISLELSNNGNVYVSFFLNEEDIKSFGYDKIKLNSEKKEITGFSSKVIDIYLGTVIGQVVDYPIMLFLTEDGKVEYVNSKDVLENSNLVCKGTIPELNSIVRINSVYSTFGYSQIAIKDDGTYLDIQQILSKNNIKYGSKFN